MDLPHDSLLALTDLLKPPDQDDTDDDKPVCTSAKLGPGAIGLPAKHQTTQKANDATKKQSKDIWDADAVPDGAEYEDVDDPRPQPEYDIILKQAVTTEDMYLQLGNKTPSSVCCEDMVVKILLPDTRMSEVEIDVTEKFLDCRTPKYKLGLHLPHPVDGKNGKAQWLADKETLVVTCQITREYDFLNT